MDEMLIKFDRIKNDGRIASIILLQIPNDCD